MNRSLTSLAALSMIAVLAVMLPPRLARTAGPSGAHTKQAITALARIPRHGDGTANIALALCHDCPPSQALVRVALRQLASGQSLPPLQLLTDRTWPALDTLAHRTRSSLVAVPHLKTRLSVTPVAIDLRDSPYTRETSPAIGLPDCLAIITQEGKRQ